MKNFMIDPELILGKGIYYYVKKYCKYGLIGINLLKRNIIMMVLSSGMVFSPFIVNGWPFVKSDTTSIEIRSTGVELSYDVTEIKVEAGDILQIRYINNSEMNHNIVFVHKEEDIRPVGIAAFQAIDTQWIPEEEMDRIMAYSKLAHPGDTVNVSLTVPPSGTYPYICTYSGHWTQMQGRLIAINND